MEDLKVLLVNTPMAVLHSGVVLSKDKDNALKDSVDWKNETALKKSHEASSLASAVLSNFTRAIMVWPDNLLQDLDIDSLTFMRPLLMIKRAAEFSVDVSQNIVQFCARAQAANLWSEETYG